MTQCWCAGLSCTSVLVSVGRPLAADLCHFLQWSCLCCYVELILPNVSLVYPDSIFAVDSSLRYIYISIYLSIYLSIYIYYTLTIRKIKQTSRLGDSKCSAYAFLKGLNLKRYILSIDIYIYISYI